MSAEEAMECEESETSDRPAVVREQLVVRMSRRPPPRFSEKTDLPLWLARFELYVRQAKIPEDQRTCELVSLLEDAPFRIVSQQGLAASTDYEAVVRCLKDQYYPDGNELEWQFKLQQRTQRADEKLGEFVGVLTELADKAYPQWSTQQRQEMVRNHFIQGVRSSSVQLKLMREMPATLAGALQLATQQETVETAQKRLHKERSVQESLAVGEEEVEAAVSSLEPVKGTLPTIKQLTRQLQESEVAIRQLQEQLVRLKTPAAQADTKPRKEYTTAENRACNSTCWSCGQRGHLKRNCPHRRRTGKGRDSVAAVSSTLTVIGSVAGRSTKLLLDTGSAVTLIREDIWKELKVKNRGYSLEAPVRAVVTANGEKLGLVGQCALMVKVGGLSAIHMVLIATSLTQECLLGADFLSQHGCVLDMQKKVLYAGGQQVHMCTREHVDNTVCFVSMTENNEIPPYCQIRLPVTIDVQPSQLTDQADVLLEPLDKFMEQHCLVVAHSLSQANSSSTVIQVLNPSAETVRVYKGEKVAIAKPISHTACSTIQEPVNPTAKARVEDVVHLMLHGADKLSEKEKNAAASLLLEFKDVIAVGNDLGHTSLVYHSIDTGSSRPVRQQARRLPVHQKQEVRELLDDMLSRGVIEPSHSPWASPIVLVRKKDGSARFCVDFRKVNDCTCKDAQPLPRIDDTLDALGGARYFSTLDLASGYWQVAVNPGDKEKTAFITPYGLYQFKVMPFGMCNAPATFQRLMERVLAGLHWTSCLVYLDDIIVFSRTVHEHLQQLREILARLRGAGLKVNPTKCHLLQSRVSYLGHVISDQGISTDPEKVKCIVDWPVPTSQKQLQSFLGLASYYRRFIKGFALVAAPLHALTNKGREWIWTQECSEAFFELKKQLMSAPILSYPNFHLQFVVDTDASGEGLGAVLAQMVGGREHVLAYASRVLTRNERKYCATRREMLALVWAVHHFRPYLYGKEFQIRTDHNCLKWLLSFKEPEGQVARWLEALAEFNYKVIHRPGKLHSNADALSRSMCRQCGTQLSEGEDSVMGSVGVASTEIIVPVWSSDEIRQHQEEDVDLKIVIDWLQNNAFPDRCPPSASWKLQSLWTQRRNLVLTDGILYRQWEDIPGGGTDTRLQLVLPSVWVPDILYGLHDSIIGGHLGSRKTLEKVRCRFYWPGQRHDVEQWCSKCLVCNSRKSPPKRRAPLEVSQVDRPLQRVAMDILGPLPETPRGSKYILVVGDYFTKWKEAYPLKNMEASSVARVFVNDFVCRFGVPESLHTDQGRNFESALIKEICQLLGVRKTRTTPYHPQSDGLVERFNKTVLEMLSMAVQQDEDKWDLLLPPLLLAYRTSVHETTGATPFSLMFGRDPRLPEDIMYGIPSETYDSTERYSQTLIGRMRRAYQLAQEKAKSKQSHQKEEYDKTMKGHPYQVDDIVFLHSSVVPKGCSRKFVRPWQGPFKVTKVISSSVYRIVDCSNPRRKQVVHFNRLKPGSVGECDPPSSDNTIPKESTPVESNNEGDDADDVVFTYPGSEDVQDTPLDTPARAPVDPPGGTEQVINEVPPPGAPAPQEDRPVSVLRRSTRNTRPPAWYGERISIADSIPEDEVLVLTECEDTLTEEERE